MILFPLPHMIKRGPVGAQTAGLLSRSRLGLLRTGSVLFREQRQGQRKSVDNRLNVSQVFWPCRCVTSVAVFAQMPDRTRLYQYFREAAGCQVDCVTREERNEVRLTRL